MRHFRTTTTVGAGLLAAVVLSTGVAVAKPKLDDRTLDGVGNNVDNPVWGAANTFYTRLDYGSANPTGNAYADGVSLPARLDGTNPRTISNVLSQGDGSVVPEELGFNDLLAWWMFHVHTDIAAGIQITEPPGFEGFFDIPVPPGDPAFAEGDSIRFRRSVSSEELGVPFPTREILNVPTAFLDLDPIYRTDAVDGGAVRTGEGGRLVVQTTAGGEDVIPTVAWLRSQNPDQTIYPLVPAEAGFALATTLTPFPGGTAVQTMFVREHNRVADALMALDNKDRRKAGLPKRGDAPELDEAVFQLARRIVEAQVQAITYTEVLPAMGVDLPAYDGYDDDEFPAVFLEFASGPMRLHTMLNPLAERIAPDGSASAPIDTRTVFTPGGAYFLWQQSGMDSILRGMLTTPAQQHDLLLDEGLRSSDPFDFQAAGDLNDLMTTHINRGRDRGVPAYTAIQAAIGVPVATSFEDITSDPEIVARLASVYDDVDDIDPVVGMLAEDREGDAMFGRTALALYELQFGVTRDSDRFWYERVVDEDKDLRRAMQAIGLDVTKHRGEWTLHRTLAELILDTTSIGDDGDVVQLSDEDDAFQVQ